MGIEDGAKSEEEKELGPQDKMETLKEQDIVSLLKPSRTSKEEQTPSLSVQILSTL